MASDSLLDVIAGLVKRDGEAKKEEKKLARAKAKEEKLKAEQEDDEEDEDEAPVGDQDNPETEPEAEPEPEEEPEEEPEDDGAGDTKPTGPDPALVQQVSNIIMKDIEDALQKAADAQKEKDENEIKLSGKKEKIDTTPSIKEEGNMGKMSFKEAIRMSVTGTALQEGYETHVLEILEDEGIRGPLGYDPFFEKGKLFVKKGQERNAQKALKNSGEINKLPKIVGEELDPEEYLSMEAVEVDGRYKGFKEALKRLTYEKLQKLKTEAGIPEGLSKEGAAEFMAAASAAKREGKKKFKFGDKEYPVTIKVDIPTKKESVKEETSVKKKFRNLVKRT